MRDARLGCLVVVLVLVLVGCGASRDEKAEAAVAELEQELLLVVDGLELDEVLRSRSSPVAGLFAFRRESNPEASNGFVRVDVVPQGSLDAPQGLVPLVDRLASQGYLLTA